MRGGGSVMMVTSCGTLVPVVTAIDTTGAAICTHGIVVMGKALQECSKFNDYEGKKQSGRGDRHTNLDAKDTAQDKCEGAKAALAKHRSENRGKPGFKKEENRLEEKVAHWKRKADATGETHGRKGKGKG